MDTDEFKSVYQEFRSFITTHAHAGRFDPAALTLEEKKELEQLEGKRNTIIKSIIDERKTEVTREFTAIVRESYRRLAAEFKPLADSVPVYAVSGNHDLTLADEDLGKVVTFIETVPKATIKGKSGLEFLVKGDINVIEIPPFFADYGVQTALGQYFVNYHSGYSAAEINAEIEKIEDLEGRILPPGKPTSVQEAETEKLKAAKLHLRELGGEIRAYQREQEARLGDPQEVDIYLTHRLPHFREAHAYAYEQGTCGDITAQYSQHAKAVHGGHFHEGQIGKQDLTKLLHHEKSPEVLQKTEIVDHTPVPLYKLNADEPWEINPGTGYFTVTEYDNHKEVERVIVYEFVYDTQTN